MSEQITITMSLEQAEAVMDACACLDVAATGKPSDMIGVFTPLGHPDSGPADNYIRHLSEIAHEVARMIRPQVDEALKRDPDAQEILHALKMIRKYGLHDE